MKDQSKKDLQVFSTKLTKKIADPSNAKKCYNSYLKRKTKNWQNYQK